MLLKRACIILTTEKLKDPEFLEQLRSLNADLQIVVAFRMLPEVVWNMPPMGTINLHGSLLPQYVALLPSTGRSSMEKNIPALQHLN